MSYYVKINFISDVKIEKMYDIMREAINEQKTRIEDIVQDNVSYGMFQSEFPLTLENYNSLQHSKKMKLLNNLIKNLKKHFQLTFVYWKEKELLGIIGDTKLGIPIEFQNSYDTDYIYEYWKDIPCLSSLVKKYSATCDTDIKEKYQKKYDYQLDLDDDDNVIDYYRRSFLYDAVVDELDIEKLLYNENEFSLKHCLLTVNTIESDKDYYVLDEAIRKYVEMEYQRGW